MDWRAIGKRSDGSGRARLDIDQSEKRGRVVSLRISLIHTHTGAQLAVWVFVPARARARVDSTRRSFAEKFISDERIRYRCITLFRMHCAGCFGNACVKQLVLCDILVMNHISSVHLSCKENRFSHNKKSDPSERMSAYGCAQFSATQTQDGLSVIPVWDRSETTHAKESQEGSGGKRALEL